MHDFAAGTLGTALIIAGLTCFSKKPEDYRVMRALMFVWAGINFLVFAMIN